LSRFYTAELLGLAVCELMLIVHIRVQQ